MGNGKSQLGNLLLSSPADDDLLEQQQQQQKPDQQEARQPESGVAVALASTVPLAASSDTFFYARRSLAGVTQVCQLGQRSEAAAASALAVSVDPSSGWFGPGFYWKELRVIDTPGLCGEDASREHVLDGKSPTKIKGNREHQTLFLRVLPPYFSSLLRPPPIFSSS